MFSQEIWDKLYKARKEIAWYRPVPDAVKAMMKKFRQQEQATLDHARSHPEKVDFALLKEGYRIRTGIEHSRPWVCASIILEFDYNVLLDAALDAHNKGHASVFAYYYDLADGVIEVVSSIYEAEEHIRGDSGMLTAQGVTNLVTSWQREHKVTPPMGVQTDLYLMLQKETELKAQLLVKDPTGYLLVDEAVKQIQNESAHPVRGLPQHILNYQIRELVVAGAQFAQKAYKLLYEHIA